MTIRETLVEPVFRIGTRTGPDSVNVLLAGSGRITAPAAPARTEDYPKHFWLELNGTPDVGWSVDVVRDGEYWVEAAVRAPGADLTLSVDGTPVRTVGCPGPEWDLVEVGSLELSAGPHLIELGLEGPDGAPGDFGVRALELTHADETVARRRRLADFRAASAPTVRRLTANRFGVMFQYGPWSYPHRGSRKPGLNAHVEAFDVERFADQMAAVGAGHVVWSLTWWTFQLAAPSSAVDRVVGHSNLTARRDLVGEIAEALHIRGILFLLYYHPGHDAHLDPGTSDWWRAQDWPTDFAVTGRGDRMAAFYHATAVFAELGLRYGTLLDGWLLDDGMLYYPAPFERLGRELRAGNPARLIAYNSWIMPRVTPFQDLIFGEGRRDLDDLELNHSGRLTSGPSRDLLAHAMTPLQAEWGVHQAEQMVPLDEWSSDGLDALLEQGRQTHVPVTLDLLMWYPGNIDPVALARLRELNPDKEYQ